MIAAIVDKILHFLNILYIDIAGGFIGGFLVGILQYNLRIKTNWGRHFLQAIVWRVIGRRYIYVFTDCDDSMVTTIGIKKALQKRLPNARVIALRTGEDVLEWPLYPFNCMAACLFLTDVGPLSSDSRKRLRIQERLKKYVHRGGCVILGHDIIYRRSRNEILQKLVGCTLNEFYRCDDTPLKYVRNGSSEMSRKVSGTELLASLPESAMLNDREYLRGAWMSDVKFLYTLAEHPEVPLVTLRTCGKGRIHWMNSGDSTAEGPPEPLSGPNEEFVGILVSIIKDAQQQHHSRRAIARGLC